ncbi:hypothetical protein Btru_014090 [Bulinus truncatus]|nr:hypothetical protein Btru_014090 [Bulinus truncatus]
MDLTELVSPHVAMPVIGVVVCAIMVFAFGFRSPVQPPSFNFEEEGDKKNKRKIKQTKTKSPINGHVINEPTAEDVTKVVSKSPKVLKTKNETPKATVKKDVRQEPKSDKKEKLQPQKKLHEKEEIVKKEKVILKKETEDDGEWTTIQVSKKSNKKKTTKKEGSRAESENEAETVLMPVIEAAAASASQVQEADESSSPLSNKSKKKKKEKTVEKNKIDEKENIIPVTQKPVVAVSSVTSQVEDQQDGKRKKAKKEKKLSGPMNAAAGAAPAAENLPQDAAPASAKSVKKDTLPATPSGGKATSSTVDSVIAAADPIKASGKKAKAAPLSGDVELTTPSVSSAPVQPELAKPSLSNIKKGKASLAPSTAVPTVTEPSKSSPKKKKGKVSDIVQEDKSEKVVDIQIKPVETTKKTVDKNVEKKKPVETQPPASKAEVETVQEPQNSASTIAPELTPTSNVSFDEVGDSWQEAAPKSKKKKPRRDN